ncbi:hypothetical protein QS306_15120 [Paraburkholderia bonniea]|uniref:hypothetical protein n=1 Tax=Paraburkholderia bonniea TaxID=2152891 RepID=UPI001FEBBEC7|nr:hypothetical protein [Paraburkholderia bonniea]WJF92090.1 hypothetical protein QS306_15120 [Paraburkholderia bonniea]WJF95410.1 hypothetical protein QS308_15125 [Paraburkholderia bonniea]
MFLSSLRGRLAAASAPALVCALLLGGCAIKIQTPVAPPTKATLINDGKDGLLIPLHVERADQDHARLGLPVQLDGKPVYLALDTGTQGVRVLSSALPKSSYPGTGPTTTLNIANGAMVSGPTATLPFSLFDNQPINITAQTVNQVRCQPTAKRCFAQDGFTGEFGWAFSGLLGVGAQASDDACCSAPLPSLPAQLGQRYLVHPNFSQPYLLLSPSTELSNRFTMTPFVRATSGAAQWPGGCVQISDKMNFCAPVVFATGGTEMIRIETDITPNWVDDDEVGKTLTQGNYDVALGVGTWRHRFNGAQVTVVKVPKGGNRIVIGLAALQNIDLLFDFKNNQLGLWAKKDVEDFGL